MRTVLFSVEPIGTKTSSCPVYDGVRPVGLFTVEGVVEVMGIVRNVNKYKNTVNSLSPSCVNIHSVIDLPAVEQTSFCDVSVITMSIYQDVHISAVDTF